MWAAAQKEPCVPVETLPPSTPGKEAAAGRRPRHREGRAHSFTAEQVSGWAGSSPGSHKAGQTSPQDLHSTGLCPLGVPSGDLELQTLGNKEGTKRSSREALSLY